MPESAKSEGTELVQHTKSGKLLDMLDECPEVRATYFIPDIRKPGGSCADKAGNVRIYDGFNRALVFADSTKTEVTNIIKLDIFED